MLNQLDTFNVEDTPLQELPGCLGIDHKDRSAIVELRRDRGRHQSGRRRFPSALRTVDAAFDGNGYKLFCEIVDG
jgi:hypothetical protein